MTVSILALILAIGVTIKFKYLSSEVKDVAGNECIVAGCSGQLCVNKGSQTEVSSCEWSETFSCYKLTKCELQENGKCGFTPKAEFDQCIVEKSSPSLPSKKIN